MKENLNLTCVCVSRYIVTHLLALFCRLHETSLISSYNE